ncbi:MAG TPA: c-type cytochrome [Spongiibacteraceae bacterium]|jgi:cytochrome c553|nr:c-type cytochrome [Spongiibacteraceae bacterium]HUH38798.1 c-type cytochrome [Spongiibacteraceae bacterium]
MKTLMLGILILFGASGAALAAGDAAAGKAKTATCAACHGPDGNSQAPTFPKLAGQHEKYLLKQLKDIKSGARPVATMAGQLDDKSEQDLADIAAYYASQSISVGQTKEALRAKGEAIYRGGISDREVPACTACHSPTGQGNGPAGFPALGGQHAEYTASQLKSFRAAADGDPSGRANDGEEARTMRSIAIRMTDSEIEAVASYIAGLHP